MHKNLFRALVAIVLLAAASSAFAESPWAGKWKLDPAQSKLTGDTIRISSGQGGEMVMNSGGHPYTFKMDGNQYKTWSGAEVTWKKVDENTFEENVKRNGMDEAMNTWTLSPDGKRLKIVTKGTRPDGSSLNEVAEYTRVSGTKGLAGSWKDQKVELNEDQTYEISDKGPNELLWNIPEIKGVLDAKLDGKDYAPQGPTVPKGMTIALQQTSPRTMKMTQKMGGEVITRSTMTLSSDGKKMTEVGANTKTNEPFTSVWIKQ